MLFEYYTPILPPQAHGGCEPLNWRMGSHTWSLECKSANLVGECFSKQICTLFLSRNLNDMVVLGGNLFSEELIKLHVFNFSMQNWVELELQFCDYHSIHVEWSVKQWVQTIRSGFKEFHQLHEQGFRTAYSALVLDLAMTNYFLDHQKMRLGPRKMHVPKVEQWSSGSEAQLASK